MDLSRVMLATDFSPASELAMRQAVEVAAAAGASLVVFHCTTLHTDDPNRLKLSVGEYMKKVEAEARDELAERASEAAQRAGIPVQVLVEKGTSIGDTILDKAYELEADLIVLGTTGRSGLRRLLLGSVAERVVRYATCPVITVGEEATVSEIGDGFDSLLVGVDFGDPSIRAIEKARNWLSPNGSLVLEHVVANPIMPALYTGGGGGDRMFRTAPELPKSIDDELSRLLGDTGGEVRVSEGDVAVEILKTAADTGAQMIVAGNRGPTSGEHVVLGSVVERVIRGAPVPVLSVR